MTMSVKPAVLRRLMREIAELKTTPPEGIRIVTSDDNLLDLTGIIQGPDGTPFAGGYFRVKFNFTEEFPAAPPKCRMLTKIFHPNVSTAGEICVNTLKKDWQSSYGIAHILVVVKCLLIHPNPESALDEEAGKLLLEHYDRFAEHAKMMTSVHATPKTPPPEFTTLTASSSSSIPRSKTPACTPTTSTTVTFLPIPPTTTSSTRDSLSNAENAALPGSKPVSTGKPAPSEKDKTDDGKTRHPSPSPLGPADENVALSAAVPPAATGETAAPASGAATKAIKRSAGGAPAEKRKKALKRL